MGSVIDSEEIKDCTEGELINAACVEAYKDAGIGPEDIDAFYLGQLAPALWSNMAGGAGHLAQWMGLSGKPGVSHDECCTTSNIGLQQAVLAVASGMYDIVLTGAVNIYNAKPTNALPAILYTRKDPLEAGREINAMVEDLAYAAPGRGMLNPLDDWAGMYARKYGLSKEKMSEVMNEVTKICKRNGYHHPKSLMNNRTLAEEAEMFGIPDVDEYLDSDIFNPYATSYMRLKQNAFFIDGGTAQIVCSTEKAKQICKHPVEIAGFASTSGWDASFAQIPIAYDVEVFKKAYAMAGISDPYTELDYLGVHDCSAQNWMIFGEDGGYFKPGEGWKDILSGRCTHLGDKPINTSGGRIGFGHPSAGANGVEIAEVVNQMRGACGERQMPNPPRLAAIQSVGGSWHFSVNVLRAL